MKKAASFLLRLLPLLVILAANAVLAAVCTESLWRSSLSEGIFWFFSRMRFSRWDFMLIFSFSLLLTALTRRVSLSVFLTNAFFSALALIHFFKESFRHEALLLTDVFQAADAAGVAGQYDFSLSRAKLVILAVLLLLPLVITFGIRLRACRLPGRLLSLAAAAALFSFSVWQADGLYSTVRLAGVGTYYYSSGLPAGLIGTRPRSMKRPDGYSEAAVTAALNGAQADSADPAVKPDIFFIMLESFYDPAKISGLTVEGDVFPNWRALAAEGASGNLLVSQYGGGTAQTEYEVLSSYRAGDTAGTAYVTGGTLKAGMASLPALLARHGYYTQAMHPSSGGTYQRKKAYSLLGFDAGTFIGNMSDPTALVGSLPADRWLFPEILSQYEKRPADQPYFAYVVTFQNHGGYLDKTVPWTIGVSGPTGDALTSAENYVNGLRLTDEALPLLFDAFRESERPVVAVLYGDHAPSFSLLGGSSAGDYAAQTTPLLIWSNYRTDYPELPDAVSAYRLGAVIADWLGFRDDPYLESLVSAPDLFMTGPYIAKDGGLVSDEAAWTAEDDRLRLLHYDRLLGQGWSLPKD